MEFLGPQLFPPLLRSGFVPATNGAPVEDSDECNNEVQTGKPKWVVDKLN